MLLWSSTFLIRHLDCQTVGTIPGLYRRRASILLKENKSSWRTNSTYYCVGKVGHMFCKCLHCALCNFLLTVVLLLVSPVLSQLLKWEICNLASRKETIWSLDEIIVTSMSDVISVHSSSFWLPLEACCVSWHSRIKSISVEPLQDVLKPT